MSISLRSIRTEKRAVLRTALFFVRIKGLEPPRLSASDPKSDVATNYTISAGAYSISLFCCAKVVKLFYLHHEFTKN